VAIQERLEFTMKNITERSEIEALLALCQVGMPRVEQEGHTEQVGNFMSVHLGPLTKRTPQDQNDWGDGATVGAFVVHRSKGGKLHGRFLGAADEVFLVGIIDRDPAAFHALEAFDSVSEMKARWCLD